MEQALEPDYPQEHRPYIRKQYIPKRLDINTKKPESLEETKECLWPVQEHYKQNHKNRTNNHSEN